MSTSPQLASSRLSPWSAFSAGELISDAPEIVRQWAAGLAAAGEPARPDVLSDHLAGALEGVGRWIVSGEDEIPDDLRSLFRDLAFAYRSRGCRLEETLRDLETLEDHLVGDSGNGEGDTQPANRSLRRAMRALWTETIQLNDALTQRRGRERADAMERFEDILSHELGNRLGAARTGVDILRDALPDLSDERRDDLLELVGDGIDAALKTVDDVGAFIQAQKWAEDTSQPFDQVVTGVLKGLGPRARSRGVALVVPDQLPDAPVDAGRVRLILSNFLVNGIRYHDPEEAEPRVRLSAERRGDELVLEVVDNGIGIPQEQRKDIFRYRRRGGNHGETEGSGLGLAIASEAVSQLGGRIELDSQVGRGTTFRVVIPVDDRSEAEVRESASS